MADQSSPQYKAIKNLCAGLVDAVSSEIDILMQKAWSKDIIGKQQLDKSLEPSSSGHRKATSFVSAIATRVSLDSGAFDQFVSLLREVQSLDYLANRLEDELKILMDNTSLSASDEASGSPYLPPAGNQMPSNEMPKLDLAEDNPTQNVESGFIEGDGDLGPLVGEQKVTSLGGVSGNSHIISPSNSQKYIRMAGGEDESVSHSGGLVEKNEEQNLAVLSSKDNDQDVSPTEEIDSSLSNQHQEMVMTASKQKLPGVSSAKTPDCFNQAVTTIQYEYGAMKESFLDLSEKYAAESEALATSRRSETELSKQLLALTEEKENLEYELQKEKSNLDHEDKIKALELQLKQTEDKVIKLQEELSKAEQESERQQQKLTKTKQQYEEERAEQQSVIDKMTVMSDDYKKKELKLIFQLILAKLETEKVKLETDMANFETQTARQKAEENAKQTKKERQKSEQLKKSHEEEMTFHQSNSEAKMKEKDKTINELTCQVKNLQIALSAAELRASSAEYVGQSTSGGLNLETRPVICFTDQQEPHTASVGDQCSVGSTFALQSNSDSINRQSSVRFNFPDDEEPTA